MVEGYPRDLVGYGRNPPHPRWPNGARICVQFVINYEEGGENNILHGDRASEGLPVGDRRRGAMAGPAAHEHGVDLRIRLPRRLLAPVADVHRARAAGHRLRRRHGPAAQPGGGRRDEGSRLGDRQPRPQMDRLQGFLGRRGAGPPERGDPHPHGGRPASARSAGTPGRTSEHTNPARRGGGRLPLHRRFLRRRAALLGAQANRARNSIVPYTLDANDMRFATPQGFNIGRPVLRLSEGQLRLRSMRKARPRRRCSRSDSIAASSAVPGAPRRWRAFSITSRRIDGRLGRASASTSPATGSATIVPPTLRPEHHEPRDSSSSFSATSSSIRPGSPRQRTRPA